MRLSHPSILLAGSLALFDATQPVAGELCKPVLSLRDVRTSQARNMQRTWTGVLIADASRCSTTSGLFEMQFTRLKEIAPDLDFSKRFTWISGRSEVSLDIWWDEWIEDYRIAYIAVVPMSRLAHERWIRPQPCIGAIASIRRARNDLLNR